MSILEQRAPAGARTPSRWLVRLRTAVPWTSVVLIPLATAAAVAAPVVPAAEVAESTYLALLAGALLVPAGFLAGARAGPFLLFPPLVVAAAWGLPAPARGVVVLPLLLGALGAAAARSILAGSWRFDRLFAVALGLEVLARSGELLPATATSKSLGLELLLALVMAACVWTIGRRPGQRPRALLAAATVATIGGGLSFSGAAALALAGLAHALHDRLPLERLAPRWRRAGLVAGAVLALLAFLPIDAARTSPTDALYQISWLLLLLPLFPLAPRSKRPLLVVALLLALFSVRLLAAPGLLLPAAILALVIPSDRATLVVAGAWSTMLLAVSVLGCAYPWLRAHPLSDLFAAAPLVPSWPLAIVVSALCALAVRFPVARTVLASALVVATGVGMVVRGPWQTLLDWPPVTLSAQLETWESPPLLPATRMLVLDTALANSAALPLGQVVANVALVSGEEGTVVRQWPLRVGFESGEWAAQRADLRHLTVPAPWISTLDASGEFFAQRYRARFVLTPPGPGDRLVVSRRPDLPRGVDLTLFRVARSGGEDRR